MTGLVPSGWEYLLVFVSLLLLVVFPVWKLCTRLGYPGWIAVGALFPVVNLILLWYLAFSRWPIDDRGADRAA